MSLDQSNDGVGEYTEIVNSTSTMSTEEMVECYMYTWMIIHFHITGYSQMVAKYSRNVQGIPYKEFYNQMFKLIQEDDVFQDEYANLREGVNTYLHNGKLNNGLTGGHALHTSSYKFIFDNKEHAMKLAIKTLSKLMPESMLPKDLIKLQKLFIIDTKETYPKSLITKYDAISGELKETKYTFTSEFEGELEDFYVLRRKGYLKNTLTVI